MPIKGLSCMIPARQEKRVPSRKLRRWVWGDDSGEKTRYQYVSVRKSITYINIWGGAWKLLIFVVFCCSLPLTLHSADWTPEDLSYHRLNAYSLCCLCLFVSLFFVPTVCPIICLLVCHWVFWTWWHYRRPWPRRCRGHWRRPLDDAISHV